MTEKIWLTAKEASEYLQITIGTLAVWRTNRTYPIPYTKCGGRIRYKLSDIENWLHSRTREMGVQNGR